jgi:hypothetical protein
MTTIAGNIGHSFMAKAANKERLSVGTTITIGASGAIGSEDADDPGVVATKNGGTGDYTIAFPVAPRGRIRGITLVSVAGTVKQANVVSFDATAGTLNFITANGGGTATNPANGDKLMVELALDVRG